MSEIYVANQRFDTNVEGVLIGSRSDFPFWAENHYRHALLRNRRANIILRNPSHPTKHLPKLIFSRSGKAGISRIALSWLEKCHPEQKELSLKLTDFFFEIHLRGILACRGRLFSWDLLFGFPALSLFAENPHPEHRLGGKSRCTAATGFPGIIFPILVETHP